MMSIPAEHYLDEKSLSDLFTCLGLDKSQMDCLIQDGFTAMDDLTTYILHSTSVDNEKYLLDINKTFGDTSQQGIKCQFKPMIDYPILAGEI